MGCNPLLLGKVSTDHTVARVGMPGVSGTLLCVPLHSADFDLYPSAIMNHNCNRAFQVALVVKNPPASAGDARGLGLIPGSGRSPNPERIPGPPRGRTATAQIEDSRRGTEEENEYRPVRKIVSR